MSKMRIEDGIILSKYENKIINSRIKKNKHFEPILVCCGFFLTVR